MELLKELQPGDPNLINTAVANKLIKAINALLSLQLVPEGIGTIKFEEGKSTLELTINVTGIPDPPETGLWFWSALDGELAWRKIEASSPIAIDHDGDLTATISLEGYSPGVITTCEGDRTFLEAD